nr:MAG TPA: hypothetical protein [Caudoviricetes sp.]
MCYYTHIHHFSLSPNKSVGTLFYFLEFTIAEDISKVRHFITDISFFICFIQ